MIPIPKQPNNSSNLKAKINELIQINGPIGLDRYIELCLYDQEFGYYTTKSPFGRVGDFVTAPEISQMFGELIGVWCIEVWQRLGAPNHVNLIELGPGRGTLMNDLLRTAKIEPTFLKTIDLHLVETSPQLKKLQQQTLEKHLIPIKWHNYITDIPKHSSIIIANEFFDAFPIQQYTYTDGDWFERVIKIDDYGKLTIGTHSIPAHISEYTKKLSEIKNGAILEIAKATWSYMMEVFEFLEFKNSAGLFIDYGYTEYSLGNTLQGVKKHQFVDILDSPGECDLTTHVNFAALRDLADDFKLNINGPVTQQEFLLSLGLIRRAGKLGYNKERKIQQQIQEDVNRLVGSDQMGHLFKVIALSSGVNDLPGFK